MIGNPTNVVYADYVAQNEAAARTLGLKLQMIPVKHGDELAGAFDAMQRERAEVLVFGPDSVFVNNLDTILEWARALKLPVIGPILPAAQRGALVSYGLDFREASRQAATYADRLLRGVKPAELPFEQIDALRADRQPARRPNARFDSAAGAAAARRPRDRLGRFTRRAMRALSQRARPRRDDRAVLGNLLDEGGAHRVVGQQCGALHQLVVRAAQDGVGARGRRRACIAW